jgi:hypothetical protein
VGHTVLTSIQGGTRILFRANQLSALSLKAHEAHLSGQEGGLSPIQPDVDHGICKWGPVVLSRRPKEGVGDL